MRAETELRLPELARVTEVVMRDGLQSFDRHVTTDDKLRILEALLRAGFTSIEVASFVRADVVPFLADAEAVMAQVPRCPGVEYRGLVPNARGAVRAVEAGVDTLVALLTSTEAYARKNQNRSVGELVDEVVRVLEIGREAGRSVDIAVAMAFFDPYAGDTPPEHVERIVDRLVDAGAQSLYVASSVGVATPIQVYELCARILLRWPGIDLGLHLHNTNGMALANVFAALQAGVRRFEGSLCGLGGGIAMPPELPPIGNIPTEDLVHLLTGLNIDTGLDLERVLSCARDVSQILGIESRAYATAGGTKSNVLRQGRIADQRLRSRVPGFAGRSIGPSQT